MTEVYGVSIGTVRRAVALLRDRGVVATLPAKGTFILGTGTENAARPQADGSHGS